MSIDQQLQDQGQDPVLNLEQYWRIVKKRWIATSIVVTSIFGLTALYTFTIKPIYESSGKLVFTKKDSLSSLTSLSSSLGDLGGLTNLSNPIETEAEIMRSEPALIKLIDSLNLKDRNGEKLSVDDFLKNLKIQSVRGTDIMEITYKGIDPQEITKIVNLLINNYIESNIVNNRTEARAAREFLSQQLPQVEKLVTQAELNLRKFKEDNRVVDLGTEARVAVESLTRLQDAIDQIQLQLVQSRAVASDLKNKLNLTYQEALDLMTLSRSPSIQQTLTEYQNLQRDLGLAKTIYTNDHPSVIALALRRDAQEQQLKDRLVKAIGNPDLAIAERFRAASSQPDLIQNLVLAEVETSSSIQRVEKAKQIYFKERNRLDSLPKLEQQQVQLLRQLQVAQSTYQELLKQYQVVQVLENQNVGNARIVSEALVPDKPISPRIALNLFIGGLLSVLLGIATALMLESLDKSLKNIEEAKRILNLPVLGTVPLLPTGSSGKQLGDKIVNRDLKGINSSFLVNNSLEVLQTNLSFSFAGNALKMILVTSSSPGEGKSFIASSLAITASKLGRRVLLIDADLRRPTQHKLAGVENKVGLSSILTGQSDLGMSTQELPSMGIELLPSGKIPPNPLNLLNSQSMASLLEEVRNTYDYIIIDAPPLIVSDSLVISKLIDGVLLVVRPGKVESDAVRNSRIVLQQMKAPILGMVINGVSKENSQGGYYSAKDSYHSDDDKITNTVETSK